MTKPAIATAVEKYIARYCTSPRPYRTATEKAHRQRAYAYFVKAHMRNFKLSRAAAEAQYRTSIRLQNLSSQ